MVAVLAYADARPITQARSPSLPSYPRRPSISHVRRFGGQACPPKWAGSWHLTELSLEAGAGLPELVEEWRAGESGGGGDAVDRLVFHQDDS